MLADELESGVGLPAELLPAGFYGPLQYRDHSIVSGTATPMAYDSAGPGSGATLSGTAIFTTLTADYTGGADYYGLAGVVHAGVDNPYLINVRMPTASLRQNSADSTLTSIRQAHFGIDTRRATTSRAFDYSVRDLLRAKPNGVDSYDENLAASTQASFIFTLDNLSASAQYQTEDKVIHATYVSGSRKSNKSITAIGAGEVGSHISSSFTALLDAGFRNFTMPLFGGFDGFDILEREPLANADIGDSTTELTNHIYNTYDVAIRTISDKELLDFNLAAAPGLTKPVLTTKLINTCEDRSDALAIIDLEGDYTPVYERNSGTSESANIGAVTTTVSNLKARGINSSYGCAYYPWVLARDTASTGATVWVPPSVIALGVMGNSEARSDLWFAPAGFNRGGLTEGAAGIPVIDVRQRLSSRDRDELYKANINPIASFPAEGIVVFGQKTLQVTPSALDRINVRRLMIFLKKEISVAAARILFDQNVEATWQRFLGGAEPILRKVQNRFGVTDFKLVLDRSTTTDELIDRNILYAKVFVKPARAIEYIAVDFFITSTGAAFEE